jgi:hypothetical protein
MKALLDRLPGRTIMYLCSKEEDLSGRNSKMLCL